MSKLLSFIQCKRNTAFHLDFSIGFRSAAVILFISFGGSIGCVKGLFVVSVVVELYRETF